MKKLFFVAFMIIGLNFFLIGQEKNIIGVLSGNCGDIITNAINTGFVKTKRFILVDRTKMEELEQEKELQKTEEFINGKTIEQGRSIGAQFLVSSYLNFYENDGHVCKFALNLRVIDVASGQILSSDIIEAKGGGRGGQIFGTIGGVILDTDNLSADGNKDNALKKALKKVELEIDKFVSKNFPIAFSIVEIQEKDSKGNAERILITGGSAYGLKKGDKLKVVEVLEIEVDGKKMQRKKEIGELKITKVEDENFCICSVNSGGIDINSKFEAKSKLQVITKE